LRAAREAKRKGSKKTKQQAVKCGSEKVVGEHLGINENRRSQKREKSLNEKEG